MRTGLCSCLTDKTFTMAAVLAGAELHAVRIGIGTTRIRGRQRKWLVAELLGSALEDQSGFGRLERRQRKLFRAPWLEWIATLSLLTPDIAGLARNAEQLFEQRIIGL